MRRLVAVAAVVLVILLALLVALYAARREAARQVLIGWLERRGIEADIQIERLELDQLVARVTVGDPDDPDFAVERVEVDYALALPWSPAGLGVTPSRIRLLRPILRASWKDGQFSLGSLDPLVEEFTGRPPGPEARGPLVLVERGRLNLDTDYGPLVARADARIEDGRLMRLTAAAPAAALRSGDAEVMLDVAAVDLTTVGERTRAGLSLRASTASTADAGLSDVALRLGVDMPYPDLDARRSEGPAGLVGRLSAAAADIGETRARDANLDMVFAGQVAGWLETFQLTGRAQAALAAASLTQPGLSVDDARLESPGARIEASRANGVLGWRVEGPASAQTEGLRSGDLVMAGVQAASGALVAGGRTGGGRSTAFEAAAPLDLRGRSLRFGELNLSGVSGRLEADVVGEGGVRTRLTGALSAARGSWPLLGAVTAEDGAEMAALKRSLADFSLSAPGLRLDMDGSGTAVRLTRPAVASPRQGGRLIASAHPSGPLYAARAGAAGGGALNLSGGAAEGPPRIEVEIPDWRLTEDGFTARLDARAAFDFDFVRGAEVETEGTLASRGGVLTYSPVRCLPLSARRLVFGENEAEALSGAFCPPAQGPLLTVRDGAWNARGRFQAVDATVPFLEMRFDQADGDLTVSGADAGLSLEAQVDAARVRDTTQPQRFYPLAASGRAGLSDEVWNGRFELTNGPHRLGAIELRHDGRSESGGVTFEAADLTFAEGGLQPQDLTPLVEGFLDPPVTGRAGFTGRFDWTPDGATSSGRLDVERLDFLSPAGQIAGLSGQVAFTSLTPLTTAPDQRLTAESLTALTPITDLALVFELGAESLRVSGADLDVAGGHVLIEPFDVSLDPSQPFAGTLVFENVQLGELIAGSGFGEQVRLDAVVSGRVPFIYDRDLGWRVADGSLYAVQPGRLEIAREALDDLEAGGGGEGVPPNVVQDLAYQAMEDLAFDVLTAQVNSLDEGRLGVLFRIRGRHDPPQRQELRMTLQDLISRRFLNRELPLPSGTQIDLTLDTTLNANQLVSDFLELQRARRGEAE